MISRVILAVAFIFQAGAALAQSSIEIHRSPIVAGLDYDIPSKKHHASLLFTAVIPQPIGNEVVSVQWSFSGCGVEPESATTTPVLVTARKPGVVKATLVVTTPTASYLCESEAWVIGGPMEIASIGRAWVRREERDVSGDPIQPWVLEYFDYDLRNGVPDTSTQVANRLVAEVMFEQPTLTEFIWLPIGSVAFYIDPEPFDTVTQYYAETPSSARADSELFLFYQLTKEGETTTVMCTSTKYWGSLKNGVNAPNYKAVTCHRPQTVVPVGSFNVQPRVQNPPYAYGDNHVLQLWSQLDPFKDVLLQERFPNGIPTTFDASSIPITFAWNGSTGSVWTTGVSGLSGNLGPFSSNEPGYKYQGKFADTLIMSGWPGPDRPFSGGQTVLSFFHRYHAATSSTSSGSFSVPLESFWGRLWTDLTTHAP